MGSCIATIMKKLLLFLIFIPTVQAETHSACLKIYTESSYIHIAQINLSCPTLKIIGSSPLDKGTTVSEFAQRYQTDVAINANFFKKDLTPLGLTITNGIHWKNTKDTRTRTLFACDTKNHCIIENKNQMSKINTKWQTVISGWQYFEPKSGQFECATNDRIGCSQDIFSAKHPRTMIGLNEKQNLLYLVVVEGRQLGFRGMTLTELAQLAQSLDLTKAINLDGGGSSTIVVKNKRLSALPFLQSSEREVGSHFGIKVE
ncbi:phosphodiester glycosidase family protein [Actinobacillus indolicus]|uniref:Phosphodiester glycosidase family protein n=2 Tax=Actinobacillus indolicus TaxID=51049 RepID=A0A4P7CJ40_9PAST|nr:phosphodiester glycosidase family protein [Actinobacillus indolicus]